MKLKVVGCVVVAGYLTTISAGIGSSKSKVSFVKIAKASVLIQRIKDQCAADNADPEEVLNLVTQLHFVETFAGKKFEPKQLTKELNQMIKSSSKEIVLNELVDSSDEDTFVGAVVGAFARWGLKKGFAEFKPILYEILLKEDYPHILYQIPEYMKYINQVNSNSDE